MWKNKIVKSFGTYYLYIRTTMVLLSTMQLKYRSPKKCHWLFIIIKYVVFLENLAECKT